MGLAVLAGKGRAYLLLFRVLVQVVKIQVEARPCEAVKMIPDIQGLLPRLDPILKKKEAILFS